MMVHIGAVATTGPGVAVITDGWVPMVQAIAEPVVTWKGMSVSFQE
jgi:hypothetical protein